MLPTYDVRPARISIVTSPPLANVMCPEWTAAVQIDESFVYSPVPQSDPALPPAGHVNVVRDPIGPTVVQLNAVAFVVHVMCIGPASNGAASCPASLPPS